MRIDRLDLVRYGAFSDRTVDFGPAPAEGTPDLHVVFGPNEAGKSTLFAAWLDLLFGFEGDGYAFDHGKSALEVRAALSLSSGKRRIARAGALAPPAEDADALAAALGSLGRGDYATMFSLDTDELETGGRAILSSEGRLGELLFSAGSGLARMGDVLAGVRADAEAIYKYRGSTSEVAGLIKEMKALDERIQETTTLARDHERLIEERDAAKDALDRADAAYAAARASRADAERMLQALQTEDERREAKDALERLGDLPEAPPEWGERIGKIVERFTVRNTRERMLGDRRTAIAAERAEIVADEAALAVASRFRALDSRGDDRAEEEGGPASRHATPLHRMTAGSDDLDRRRAELAEVEGAVASSLRALGVPQADPETIAVPCDAVAALRELADEGTALRERREAALEERNAAREALNLASAEADGVCDGSDWETVGEEGLRAVESALRAVHRSGVLATLSDATRKADAARLALDAALRDAGIEQSQLSGLAPPSAARIEAWRERERELERRSRDHATSARELEREKRGIEARRQASDTPGDVETRTARAERDAAWNAHRAALTVETAEAFARAMAADDDLAARRLLAADRLAERRRDDVRLATIGAERSMLDDEAAGIASDRDTLANEIADALEPAQASGLVGPSPDGAEASTYAERFARLRELASALDAADVALMQHEADANDALARLAEAVPVALPKDDQSAALDRAEAWLSEVRDAWEGASRAARLVQEREAQCEARDTRLASAERAEEAWRVAWDDVLAGTFCANDPRTRDREGAPAIRRTLALVDEASVLATSLEKRRALQARIGAMEADREAFLGALGEVAAALGEDEPIVSEWRSVYDRIERRIAGAVAADARAEELDAVVRELEAEARSICSEADADEAALAPMREALGVAEPRAIASLLEDVSKRDALRERAALLLRRIASTLALEADEALVRIEAADRDALAMEIEDLERDEARLSEERDAARDLSTRARKTLEDVGGDGASARLVAERQTLAEQLADRMALALALDLGAEAATRALHRYREKHRSGMMDRASDAFARISCGAFGSLITVPGKDGQETIAARRPGANGRTIGVLAPKGRRKGGGKEGGLSKGTLSQLYLSLRMAGYHEYAAHRAPPPFVCDDVMETFDDERSSETLRLFADMATRGQVIVLTHHRHLVDLARETVPGVRCHDLPGPATRPGSLPLAAE